MSRPGFDLGDSSASVAAGGGKVFKNPTVGPHEAIISAIVHVGSFQDHFKKGSTVEIKPPCNFVLVRATLMGPDDKNEDESRMEQWIAVALKSGDKATLTKLMFAVDPSEKMAGFADFIKAPLTADMVGSDEKGDDNLPLYVNWKGFSGCTGRMAAMVNADVEAENPDVIGLVAFNDITKEVLDAIPAHMVRQYYLDETSNGKNLSVAGSPVESVIKAAREADPQWKKQQAKDAKPDDKKPLDTGAQVPQAVPEAQNAPAPAMSAEQEY
jgi:hypothetical protein